ncbi:MAG: hypothetical protein ACI9IP_000168 [Arcticibacterium sp.]|jgi:hypothetical protein
MIFSTGRFMYLGWIRDHFIQTQFQFTYYGFEWVTLLSPFWMYLLHVIMLLAAVGVMLGFLYRLSAILLFLSFTYTELIDLTYYLNHYYFVSLVCLLLIFIPANRFFSFDSKIWPRIRSEKTLLWHIDLLKFQIFVVYFFAGIAKINQDWLLNALPMKIWLPAHDTVPILGSLFSHPWAPHTFSWLGMFYDTFIVYFLLNSRTRPLAYLAVIAFHLTVGVLFQIGVFPIVMIGVTLIFFSPEWHKSKLSLVSSFLKKGKGSNYNNLVSENSTVGTLYLNTWTPVLISLYVAIQLLFPFRYARYPGNMFWTEQGYRFSWRVMLMEKAGTATFYIKDPRTGREGIVNNSEFLNAHQEKQMSFQPDMILQFAHFLGNHYQESGKNLPEVRAEAWVTLNARPSQLIIDPHIDLMRIRDSWANKSWIIPIQSPK